MQMKINLESFERDRWENDVSDAMQSIILGVGANTWVHA